MVIIHSITPWLSLKAKRREWCNNLYPQPFLSHKTKIAY
ncbi:hypothetical protein SSYIS1_03960 [Serratia symbiotica]|uniref:Uncharacterized protein n=1 Tax=Serratia symbiotica TaxID=138074 RepID=A0A455VI53_9GAMM|nr:hypothetical protein SSYIS1_03960 [Serratia symbiotica]